MELTRWFRELLPPGTKVRPSDERRWIECFEQLIETDERKPADIRRVCEWARKDPFWGPKLLSPLKLRQTNRDGVCYFDTLSEQEKGGDGHKRPARDIDPPGWAAFLKGGGYPYKAYGYAPEFIKSQFLRRN